MKFLAHLTSLVLASGVSAFALAQDADEAQDENLETVTVIGTRTEKALSDVAATVTVKDAEEIEREIARDIADLVRFEPGVSVGGTGSRFGLGGFTIRGIGGNRVLTVVDGIRVPEEFSFGPFLSARRDFVDLDSLDRAEIARGPISSLYGSDALGGVVALTTRTPQSYLRDGDPFYTGLKVGYSSADESTVGTVTFAGGDERLAGLLTYTRRDFSETDNSGSVGGTGLARELPDPQSIETDNIVGRVTFAPSDAHSFSLGVDYFTSDTDTQILSDYGLVSRGTVTNTRDAVDTRERTRVSASYEFNGSLGFADRIQTTLYRQDSETFQITNETRTSPTFGPQTRERLSRYEQEITGIFGQFDRAFSVGSTEHLLSYGFDWYQTDNASRRDGATFTLDGTPLPEFTAFPTRDFPLTEVTQTAFFLQDEILLLDGRLSLSPGLRYDNFDADATADAIYLGGNPGSPPPEDYDDSEVTAKLGVVYDLTDTLSIYARYSEGFRAPPYDDVNVGFTNFIGGYKTIANPNLNSERSDGFELGLGGSSERAQWRVSVFQNDYDDFIESFAIAPQFLPFGGIDPADGLLTFQSINRGAVEIKGAEARGEWLLGGFSSALEDFRFRASIAYADGEDQQSGAPLNTIEPLSGVLGFAYDAPSGRWGGELLWTLVAGKDESDIDGPRLATDGYGIVDVIGYYDFSDRISLSFGLFNVGDREYIRWIDTAGIGADAPRRFTQPGFNAGATLRVEL
ncbi:MAG: TonB-dependent hemoglobin/transferrin/lactoferrin family receptor [Pseudomonadota bacterium]